MFRFRTPYRRACWLLLVALAICTVVPTAARAQVRTEVSPAQMTKILASIGLEAEPYEAGSDSTQSALRLELGGYRVMMLLANGNTDAQLYAGFRDRKVKKEKINEWNRTHRFSRAYLDKDGDPILESDIDFTGGVTEANIKAWVKLYRDMLGGYARYLD